MRKMKKQVKWPAVLGFFMGIASFFTIVTGFRVYKKTFKTKPNEITRKRIHERRLKTLDEYEHQKFFVESPRNKYNVETLYIKAKRKTNDVIILVHGIRGNYYDLLPVAFRYLNDGYNIVMYNQRQSGLTGGENSTFGLYEKYDLEEVATITRRLYAYGKIGVHGFSMGAATAIMQSELNEQNNLIDYYVLDAPFHTMASTIELAARRGDSTKMPPWYIRFAGDTFLRLRKRVSYKQIMPLEAIKHTTKPVLLIHGEKDDITSPEGSRLMYKVINHDKKRLEIFDNEEHCTVHYRQEDEYFKRIYQFIADYMR